MATVKKASNDDAHWSPSLWYICTPNRGKAAAKEQRTNALAASTLAAYMVYVSTK